MVTTTRSLRASVRAYRDRDWGLFERIRDRELGELGPSARLSAALRVVQQLRVSARALRPEWPTEADREADLENHRRVATTLARTAGFSRPASPARSRRRRR